MFYLSSLKPIKFHPYTSDVRKRIIYMEFTDETDVLRACLLKLFNNNEIKAYDDNKIVFECELHGAKMYYGFYDLKFSIGLDYFDENEKNKV